jgi:hypothetical protein
VLWQAAHDLCERDAEAAPGDRWQWSEPSAQTVERLRRRLRLPALADQEDSTTDASEDGCTPPVYVDANGVPTVRGLRAMFAPYEEPALMTEQPEPHCAAERG